MTAERGGDIPGAKDLIRSRRLSRRDCLATPIFSSEAAAQKSLALALGKAINQMPSAESRVIITINPKPYGWLSTSDNVRD